MLKFGFIGAGQVGTAMSMYLKHNGFNVNGFYSINYEDAVFSGKLCNADAYKNLCELIENCNFIFITTNDDSIISVVKQIVDLDISLENYSFAHTSGAISSDILMPLAKIGGNIFSIHPLQSFASVSDSIIKLKNTMFVIEGNQEINVIKGILEKTGNKYKEIDKSKKYLYHAGACIISNYLVTLINNGYKLFEQAGFENDDIYYMINSLLESTIYNINKKGVENALTGPIKRGDIQTVTYHIDNIKDKEIVNFYKDLGLHTLRLIKDEGKKTDLEKILYKD